MKAKMVSKKEVTEDLIETLRLVQIGLKSGSIKSKPIIVFSKNGKTCDIKSLSEIVDKALKQSKVML